jgi:hypothetical protein
VTGSAPKSSAASPLASLQARARATIEQRG